MNPRHMAALTLVSWFLVIPPNTNLSRQWEVPLSQWQVYKTFDTGKECVSNLMDIQSRIIHDYKGKSLPLSTRPLVLGQCVASDDPRLKGK